MSTRMMICVLDVDSYHDLYCSTNANHVDSHNDLHCANNTSHVDLYIVLYLFGMSVWAHLGESAIK
jgi:hypothetical protein